MHIIVPMSGLGTRFINSGYKDPKPLIKVDGKYIIEHVCELFPSENHFSFICNSKHLKETNMREILLGIKPEATIFEISVHKKGPVYAVSQIFDSIKDNEEVIVNYCDFGTYWNYDDFLKHTRDRDADGAIPSYKNFHPHMLGDTNYAFIKDQEQWMVEIKEKEPFTNNRMNEFASNGTYYFKKGSYVKKYFKKLIENNININGEYYVSLVYNLLVQDSLKVSIYNIQHMLQWGTPQDLEIYLSWSKYFRKIIACNFQNKSLNIHYGLIPLAGKGARFKNAGYETPKPLLEVSGKSMIIQAALCLPHCRKKIFIILKEHLVKYNLEQILKDEFKTSKIIPISKVTEGQAITCGLGLKNLNQHSSLLISATDNSMIYNKEKLQLLISDTKIDTIIFTFKNHISSKKNPHMYGWVAVDTEGYARNISVKIPLSDDTCNDHAIVGTFYFKKVKYYLKALNNLIKKNIKVNGEYYVDSLINELINLKYNVKVFEIDEYICWGTPDDYKSFIYWQSFFHKVSWHPYTLDKDPTVNKDKVDSIKSHYSFFEQEYK